MNSKIKLDKSECSIVVRCTGCQPWYGFALDIVEAWQVGARHQERAHPGNMQAAKSLHMARATHRAGLKLEDQAED